MCRSCGAVWIEPSAWKTEMTAKYAKYANPEAGGGNILFAYFAYFAVLSISQARIWEKW